MPKYTDTTAEQYADQVDAVISNIRLKSDCWCPAKSAPFLFTIPYKALVDQMSDEERRGQDTLKGMITFFTVYYEMADDRGFAMKDEEKKIKNIFLEFSNRMKKLKVSPKTMTAKGMYRLLRHTYISLTEQDYYNDFYKGAADAYKKDDASLLISREGVKNCMDTLDGCYKVFRGSSDAFKEIERELKDLYNFIGKDGSVGSTGVRGAYVRIMLRALAEKADSYVRDRNMTELNCSETGYKGKRIAAMRKVSVMLKAQAKALDDSFEKLYRKENNRDFVDNNPEFVGNLREQLTERLERMTFNRKLYAEIRYMSDKGHFKPDAYKTDNPVLVGMDRALGKEKIASGKCDKIYEECMKQQEKLSQKLNRIATERNFRAQFQSEKSLYDKEFDYMTKHYENLSTNDTIMLSGRQFKFLVGDKYTDRALMATSSEVVKCEASLHGVNLPETDIYQIRYKKNLIAKHKKNEKIKEQRIEEEIIKDFFENRDNEMGVYYYN